MSKDDAIPLGGIIGIAVAGVGLLIVAAVILYLVCTKYAKKEKESRKEEVVYAEVGDYSDNSGAKESSHYAKVEFKKSDKFKKQKKKVKEVEKEKTVPVYAEINFPPQPPSQPDSPEPRYANINIQSSV